MYVVIVVLTMLVLPASSILIARGIHPEGIWMDQVGLWFVFWAVGVRLGLAGARQILRPDFTAREIFKLDGDGALIIVRELGFANLAIGVVGLLVVLLPSFVLPAAIYASIFYAAAGTMHLWESKRGRNENVAMLSDFFAAIVLAGFVLAKAFHL
jgi:hypothetical protein